MGKVMTIIRHAKSDWSSDCDDFDRVINQRGHSDAALVGEYLKANGHQYDALFSSTATRAKLTTQIITSYVTVLANNILFLFLPI